MVPALLCPQCGTDLTRPCAVSLAQRFDARLDASDGRVTVVAAAFSINSVARCVTCGCEVQATDVDSSLGDFGGP